MAIVNESFLDVSAEFSISAGSVQNALDFG